ncbi:signal peptidase I [Pedosphaera parvula]|nr:signal peptidase I [Pedosphaera parvula]
MSTPLCMVAVQENESPSPGLPKRRRRGANINWVHVFRQMALCAVGIPLAFGCYLIINQHFFGSIQIVGHSMSPTLRENGQYLVKRWKLRDYTPKAQDIVVIKDPADQGLSVERIVAVEGQSVHFKDGKVFVDGKELQERYLSPGTLTYTYSQKHEQLILCGRNQFFVLGDNRLASIDSRSYGPVPRANIRGLLLAR